MLADSIPAAHLALTETSAHPVSKSSFQRKTTRSNAHSKEALDGTGWQIRPKLVAAMSARVTTGKARIEHMTSASPRTPDI